MQRCRSQGDSRRRKSVKPDLHWIECRDVYSFCGQPLFVIIDRRALARLRLSDASIDYDPESLSGL